MEYNWFIQHTNSKRADHNIVISLNYPHKMAFAHTLLFLGSLISHKLIEECFLRINFSLTWREYRNVSILLSHHLKLGTSQEKFLKGLKDSLLTSGRTGYVFTPFFALKGVIPSKYYGIWIAFVHACQLLCRKVITKECMEAEHKLMLFCVMLRSLLWEGEVHTKHAWNYRLFKNKSST